MAAMAKSAAEASPRPAFQEKASAELLGGHEMMSTPAVAMRMASAKPGVTWSPRNIKPKMATCTGSVFTQAVVTTNERCCMIAGRRAVAPICALAPVAIQAIVGALSSGQGRRVVASTMARNATAKGRPNRKRT